MHTDEELMAAHVAGDSGAFRELFSRYGPRITRMYQARGLGEVDSRDLTQQTFLHLHRARMDFRPGARLKPWLFTIAVNVRREHFRRLQRRPEAPLDAAGEPVSSALEADPARAVRAAEVRRAVGSLNAGQQEVISLHWFEGFTFPEIAEIVGASVSAVKVRAHRGYAVLRRLLSDEAVGQRQV